MAGRRQVRQTILSVCSHKQVTRTKSKGGAVVKN